MSSLMLKLRKVKIKSQELFLDSRAVSLCSPIMSLQTNQISSCQFSTSWMETQLFLNLLGISFFK